MGKRKGNQRQTEFRDFDDAEFRERFYDRRADLDASLREKVQREGKARGFRNLQKRKR